MTMITSTIRTNNGRLWQRMTNEIVNHRTFISPSCLSFLSSSIPVASTVKGCRDISVLTTATSNINRSSLRHSNYNTASSKRSIHIEKKLKDLGIILPTAPSPKANYNIICYTTGNMMYISGHLPIQNDGTLMTGRIGPETDGGQTIEHGYTAARYAGLNIIATLKEQLGDLDRVEQIVKVFGIVQSTNDFKEQHKVMDGCSDIIMEVFGKPIGYHARSAIGTNTLPLNMSVEVEAIVQIKLLK